MRAPDRREHRRPGGGSTPSGRAEPRGWPSETPREPVRPWVERLLGVHSRGEIREAGEWLDGPGRPLRPALVAAAVARGADVHDDPELSGKQLLRRCLARSDAAQTRTTPIHRDEAFPCARCGRDVPPGGRRPRDHCPWCLWSQHVDDVPGDRAAGCGGGLEPVGVETRDGVWMIRYRCARCGAARVNRVLSDCDPPDDPKALYALAEEAGRRAGLR